jgi:DNA-binding MurR/RpiR family transcriptional regulator
MIPPPHPTDLFRVRLAAAGALPPAGRRVADYIDGNRAAVLASSAMELAAATGTSDATVIRTVQALGFAGLGAMKQALVASVAKPSTLADAMRRTLDDVGESTGHAIDLVLEVHQEAMDKLRQPAVRTLIAHAVAVLHPAARIAVFGIGPSAALSDYTAVLLTRTGRQCLRLDVTGAMLADRLMALRTGDAVLVLAYGRAYKEVVAVFDEARRLGLPIVVVTDSLDANLARFAKVVLPAGRGRANQVALHGATLVCLEALILGLAAADGDRSVTTLQRLHRLRSAVQGG